MKLMIKRAVIAVFLLAGLSGCASISNSPGHSQWIVSNACPAETVNVCVEGSLRGCDCARITRW